MKLMLIERRDIQIHSIYLLVFLPFIFFISCNRPASHSEEGLNKLIDSWHLAAAQANKEVFFGLMDTNFVYLGTDATERWNKTEFYTFSKPHFDRDKAWDFRPYDRTIMFSSDQQTAWFDELLDTWMGTCRGSGVLVYINEEWKLSHYNLSVMIPNDLIEDFISLVKNNEGPGENDIKPDSNDTK